MEHQTDVEARIDSDFAGRSWAGLWGNRLRLLLTILTTSLLANHRRAIVPAATVIGMAGIVRWGFLLRRECLDSFGPLIWRRCATAVTLFDGAVCGGPSAYLIYRDDYHHPDVRDKKLIVLYGVVLYARSCFVKLFAARANHSAFPIIHGCRSSRDYLSRPADNHALACISAGQILSAIQMPVQLAIHIPHGGASVAISFFPDDARDSGDPFRTAGRAMYSAKREGGSRYTFTGDVLPAYAVSNAASYRADLAQRSSRIHKPAPRQSAATGKVGNS